MRVRLICVAGFLFGCLVSGGYGAVIYVATGSASDGPGDSWANAFHTIQGGVDAAVSNDTVLVSNGVYSADGRAVYGSMTNRVVVDKAITVKSVNGPDVTIIEGEGPNGSNAVRCVYLGTNAVLSGFTLTNGHTHTSGDYDEEQSGGGVWCASGAVVSNCVITGNSASWGGGSYNGTLNNCTLAHNRAPEGGGTYFGTLNNCTLSGNSATWGGGASGNWRRACTLNNCIITGNSVENEGYYSSEGGGSFYCILINCTLTYNTSSGSGGGSDNGILYNCTLSGNSASWGGGSYDGTLNNCTLIGNSASDSGGGSSYGTLYNCTLSGNSASEGGGSDGGTLNNCIVWGNTDTNGVLNNYSGGTLSYCCTTPLPSGTGNISDDPLFVDAATGDFHLRATSPCIDKGNNAYASGDTDLDGNPRIIKPHVDMGAYEYIYSVTDYDGDRISNSDEALCNTDPLDPSSVLKVEQASVSNLYITLRCPAASGALYTVESSDDLTVGFTNIVEQHIAGTPPQNVYQVQVSPGQPRYYRVRLEH